MCLKWNAVNWAQDATCLQRARQLYIPKQLKPIKTAVAGNWSANRETELWRARRKKLFFPHLSTKIWRFFHVCRVELNPGNPAWHL